MHLVDALLAGDAILGGLPDQGGDDGDGAEEEGEHGDAWES